MGVQRVQQSGFAQVANGALRDRRLSWKARGILAYALSHSDGYEATETWLIEASDKDGRDSVRSALVELERFGYRKKTKVRDKAGQIRTVVEWFQYPYGDPNFVYPTPRTGNQAVG